MHDFRTMYREALSVFEEFQGYAAATFLGCCNDNYFLSIKTSFHLAEDQYKEVNRLCNDLALWHAAKVDGKSLSQWSEREREENTLVRSLLKATSGLMSALQTVYLPWLTKSQLTEDIDEARST